MASAVDMLLVSSLLKERLLPWQQTEGSAWTAADASACLCDPSRRRALLSDVLDALRPRTKQMQASLGRAIHEALQSRKSKLERKKTCSGAVSLRDRKVAKLCVDSGDRGRHLVASAGDALPGGVPRGTVVFSESPLDFVELDPSGPDGTVKGGLAAETALALRLWQSHQEACSDLLDHGGQDMTARLFRAVLASACCRAASDFMTIRKEVEVVESMFVWLGRVRINAAAVTTLSESEGILETRKGALALYPTLATSLNHSCRPNCVLRFDGVNVDVVVSSFAGVRDGVELTISYGPVATSIPRRNRKQALLSQYGFDCRCPACLDEGCEDYDWRETASKLDARAQEEVSKDNWSAAAVAAAAMVQALSQGYDEGDIELARERCKLAGILLRSGNPGRAREEWASAAGVLEPLVSRDDPDLEEALEMVKRLPAPRQEESGCKTRPKPELPAATEPVKAPQFTSATSPGAIARALVELDGLLKQAAECHFAGQSGAEKVVPPRGPSKKVPGVEPASTTVSSDIQGVVLGLENLNLTPAEERKLAAALAETGAVEKL